MRMADIYVINKLTTATYETSGSGTTDTRDFQVYCQDGYEIKDYKEFNDIALAAQYAGKLADFYNTEVLMDANSSGELASWLEYFLNQEENA